MNSIAERIAKVNRLPATLTPAETAEASHDFARVVALQAALEEALEEALCWDVESFKALTAVPDEYAHLCEPTGRSLRRSMVWLLESLRRTSIEGDMPPSILQLAREQQGGAQ